MKFLKSVVAEMKIVTWPSRKKLKKDVIIVIETTLLFAAYFWLVDIVLDFIMKSFV